MSQEIAKTAGQPPTEHRANSIAVGGLGAVMSSMGDMVEFAKLMAHSKEAVPVHLRGNTGACLAVLQSALRWNMEPFAVAQQSYLVTSKKNEGEASIAYQAQLVMALINTRAGLKSRLAYAYSGNGGDLVCSVTGVLRDGSELVYESPLIKNINPKNSPLWGVDPRRQLTYWSARAWARVHVPEVLMGVYTIDDLQDAVAMRDITPAPRRNLIEERKAARAEPTRQITVESDGPPEPTISERAAAAALDFGIEDTEPAQDAVQDVTPEPQTKPEMEEAAGEGGNLREALEELRVGLNAATDAESFYEATKPWMDLAEQSDDAETAHLGDQLIQTHEIRLEHIGSDREWSAEQVAKVEAKLLGEAA